MLKIGLTGGIGSGKTTVSNLFVSLGVPVIDTDVIAHELTNNKLVLDEIINCLGKTLLDQNGKLNRKALAQLVFDKLENRQKLENILHPKIRDAVNEKIHLLCSSNPDLTYIIIVIPLLIETDYSKTDFSKMIDRVLVVMSDEKDRIKRISQRDNRNMDEIRSIISAQASDRQRIDIADDIIKNNSDISELDTQVEKLHTKFITIAASIR